MRLHIDISGFCQPEDGIRDYKVTGVQDVCSSDLPCPAEASSPTASGGVMDSAASASTDRKSVGEGKRVDLGGRRIIKKKKSLRDQPNRRSALLHRRIGSVHDEPGAA